MTYTLTATTMTIPLEDCISGRADIEILRAELRVDISSPLALIRYSEHGCEPQYGIRLDLDKKVFIDHLEDVEQESYMQQVAPELASILNPLRQEVRFRQLGYVKQNPTSSISTTDEQPAEVAEAGLAAGKRQGQHGSVEVYSRATEMPVETSVNLREEHITVEGHAAKRSSSQNDFADLRGGTIEVTKTAEVPVIAREAHIVEEVIVGKGATERTQTVHDTMRRADVEVEQIPAASRRMV